MNINVREIIIVKASENNNDNHIPSTPKIRGRVNTKMIWNISVRQKEITALISPLLSEVKNEEPNIANPAKK